MTEDKLDNVPPPKIAMVNYFNTLPFSKGLSLSNQQFQITLDVPAKCIEYFKNDQVDIALVPVGSLPDLERDAYEIITDYCIGCVNEVRTVCLLSNTNLGDINVIYLDKDSRTSVELVQILCEHFWQISPKFIAREVRDISADSLQDGEAALMIGDKVFEVESDFQYNVDLGLAWGQFTKLPFTFAVWIAKPSVSAATKDALNTAIAEGVIKIPEVIEENDQLDNKIDLEEYFSEHIDYYYDEDKKEALRLFLSYLSGA